MVNSEIEHDWVDWNRNDWQGHTCKRCGLQELYDLPENITCNEQLAIFKSHQWIESRNEVGPADNSSFQDVYRCTKCGDYCVRKKGKIPTHVFESCQEVMVNYSGDQPLSLQLNANLDATEKPHQDSNLSQ